MTNKKLNRALGLFGAGALAAGGLVIGGAGAASAAECVAGGLSRTVGPDGVPSYQNDPRCGEVYQYETPIVFDDAPPPPLAEPSDLGALPWGCAGVVAQSICSNWPAHWGEPPAVVIDYLQQQEETVPEGNVEVGEPETVPTLEPVIVTPPEGSDVGGGGFFGGGFFGGGFFGGGSSGGSSGGTATVGDVETIYVETSAE